MKFLPHEINPNTPPPVFNNEPPTVGKGNTRIPWAKLAPQVKDMTQAEAVQYIGCSLAAVQNAVKKGWITVKPNTNPLIDWEQYLELSKQHTTYELAKKIGLHVRTVQRANSAGLLDCKPGQPNGWTKNGKIR